MFCLFKEFLFVATSECFGHSPMWNGRTSMTCSGLARGRTWWVRGCGSRDAWRSAEALSSRGCAGEGSQPALLAKRM